MRVAQYTFKSPSSTPIQVGRLDPNSVKQDVGLDKDQSLLNSVNETLTKAKSLEVSQVHDVSTSVSNANILDLYV